MACSKFEYVKEFEEHQRFIPKTWIVTRIDGRSFHKFSREHSFTTPNDERCLRLMSKAACKVLDEIGDIILAYGHSDEFSFLFSRDTKLYNRRKEKISTAICSLMSSNYVYHWGEFFGEIPLKYPPSFDARSFHLPTVETIRDYFSWRQADCHVNNLYNTAFWAILKDPEKKTAMEAHAVLKDTCSSEKNELLFSKYKINYNNEPQIFRKGTVICKTSAVTQSSPLKKASENKSRVNISHVDIIGDRFWSEFSCYS